MFDKINNWEWFTIFIHALQLFHLSLSESVMASKIIVELKLITVNIHLFTCIQFLSFCAMTNMNFIKYTFIHKLLNTIYNLIVAF